MSKFSETVTAASETTAVLSLSDCTSPPLVRTFADNGDGAAEGGAVRHVARRCEM